jgi:hypothetical protein
MEGAADPENITDERLLKILIPKKQWVSFMDPEKRKNMMMA